jgi:RNA polymerase primary sigma factor
MNGPGQNRGASLNNSALSISRDAAPVDPSPFGGEAALLKMFMADVKKYPLLSRDEEQSLAMRAAAGDRAGEARLVESNLRFVVSISFKYWFPGSGLSVMDLISEGCFGLMRAVKRFDVARQVRLLTYAAPAIRYGMLRLLADHRKHLCESLNEALYQEDGDGETVLDRLASEVDVHGAAALHADLRDLVKRLTAKEQSILHQRFFKESTTLEIGRLLGVSAARVRQVELKALRRLRWSIEDEERSYIS